MIRINVKFLASYIFATGKNQITVNIPEKSTVGQLVKILDQKSEEALLDRKQTIVAVNSKVSPRDHILNESDRVIIFHQMRGG